MLSIKDRTKQYISNKLSSETNFWNQLFLNLSRYTGNAIHQINMLSWHATHLSLSKQLFAKQHQTLPALASLHASPKNTCVQRSCLDFMWSTASRWLWFWVKIPVVFSNCCGTETQAGAMGREVYDCAPDLPEKASVELPDFCWKATLCYLLPFFSTSSLPYPPPGKMKWVLERRKYQKFPIAALSLLPNCTCHLA